MLTIRDRDEDKYFVKHPLSFDGRELQEEAGAF